MIGPWAVKRAGLIGSSDQYVLPVEPTEVPALCGHRVPTEARFCPRCGARLAAGPGRFGAGGATLRNATVLIADIVGSVGLGAGVGAEPWSRLSGVLFSRLERILLRFDGTVSQFTGDGVVAVFGVPSALEGHAQRACRAALEIARIVKEASENLRLSSAVALKMRIALESGPVVAEIFPAESGLAPAVLGEAVAVAERLEAMTAAGEIWLGPGCARLVSSKFRIAPLSIAITGGVAGQIWRLEGRLSRAEARSQALPNASLRGRDRDLATLERLIPSAGMPGSAVALIGPAGVGKSRLCEELLERARHRGVRGLLIRSRPHERRTPFRWVARLVAQLTSLDSAGSGQMITRLARHLRAEGSPEGLEIARILVDGLATRTGSQMATGLLALINPLVELIRRREVLAPRILIVDEVSWVDRESRVAIDAFLEMVSKFPILLVLTAREARLLPPVSGLHHLVLAPLRNQEIKELARELVGDEDPRLREITARLTERAGGLPLYPVEVVRDLVARGRLRGTPGAYHLQGPLKRLEIPDDVRAALCGRVDALSAVKREILETAAVMGATFDESTVAAALDLPKRELRLQIEDLVQLGLLRDGSSMGDADGSMLAFTHPLLQEVIAGLMLGERSRTLHRKAATALAGASDATTELSPRIATHWARAGEPALAALWCARAGRWMQTRNLSEARRWWRLASWFGRSLGHTGSASVARAAARRLSIGYRCGMSASAARMVAGQGLRAARQAKESGLAARILSAESLVLAAQGLPDEATRIALRARALAGTAIPVKERLRIDTAYLHALFLRGAVAEMLVASEALLADIPALEDPDALSQLPDEAGFALLLRAHANLSIGRLEAGGADLETLLACRPGGRGPVRSLALGSRATLALLRGEGAGEALVAAEEAVLIAEAGGGLLLRVLAHWGRGLAAVLLGDLQASSSLDQALTLIEDAGIKGRVAVGIGAQLALRDLAGGHREQARLGARRAWEWASSGQDLWLIQAGLALARVLREAEGGAAHDEAARALSRSWQVANDHGYAGFTPQLLEEMAAWAATVGLEEEAAEIGTRALNGYRMIGARGHIERLSTALAVREVAA